MKCPRCNNEWDVRQSPCPRCNLSLRVSGRQGAAHSLVPIKDALPDNPSSSLHEEDALPSSTYQLKLANDSSIRIPLPARLKEVSPLISPKTEDLLPKIPVQPVASRLHPSNFPQVPPQFKLSPSDTQSDFRPLPSSTLLSRNRYRLHQVLHKQEWPLRIMEIIWSAFDNRFSGSPVIVYELILPDDASSEVQSIPYTATKTFTSIGRHPNMQMLRDVFQERGHHFFVFEPVSGLPLSVLMEKNGGTLPEQEVVSYCLQMTSLLDIFSQRSISLVHGNIRPEYIVKKSTSSDFVLTNFSVVLAGGLASIMADRLMDSSTLPEILRGKLDSSSDLYVLLATACYALTGLPLFTSQSLAASSELSAGFRTILSRGFHLSSAQRYQTPAELYQDLLALSHSFTASGSLSSSGYNRFSLEPRASVVPEKDQAEALFESVESVTTHTDQSLLLPLPEELSPLKHSHDHQNAFLWFVSTIVCLALFFIGRGL